MSNSDELLHDARRAARELAEEDELAGLDSAARLADNFTRLDDHMNSGAYPPADWARLSVVLPSRDDLLAAIKSAATIPGQPADELADKMLAALAGRVSGHDWQARRQVCACCVDNECECRGDLATEGSPGES